MWESFNWNWEQAIVSLVRLLIAFAIAFPIGWDRSRSQRQIGLRTFPLVAMSSCGFVLIASQDLQAGDDALARALQGLIAGIGFLGGGAILKEKGSIQGLATATSIWNTAAIGAAVATGREEIALVLGLTNFVLLRVLTPLTPTDDYVQSGEVE